MVNCWCYVRFSLNYRKNHGDLGSRNEYCINHQSYGSTFPNAQKLGNSIYSNLQGALEDMIPWMDITFEVVANVCI